MSRRLARRLPAAAVVATAALMVFGAIAGATHGPTDTTDALELIPFMLLLLAMPVLGLLITRAQPGNPIGWIFCATPVLVCLSLGFGTYAEGSHDAAALSPMWCAQLLAGIGWPVGLIGFALLVPALFPSGRPVTPRWRWVVRADLVALVVLPLALVVHPPAAVIAALVACAVGLLLAGLASSVLRYRRVHGDEKLQMRLVVWAIALTFVLFLVNAALGGYALAFGLTYALIPGAIGMAMLRYRLYDVDVIVRRTVTYGCLIAALAAIYLAAIAILGAIVRGQLGQSSAVAVTLSTLLAAAAFQPLRTRIRHLVDRRFHRLGYDPAEEVGAFSGRLREEVDLDALSDDLLDVVARTVQPRRASVWLRPVTMPERQGGTP